jgi:thioredoxin reductase
VAIIGGGVAGLSAALFLARAKVTAAVYDQHESSLYRVSRVNNYLGFPAGVAGAELIDLGRRQAQLFGAGTIDADVVRVSRIDELVDSTAASAEDVFRIETTGGEDTAAFVLLASNKRTDIATSLGLELGGHGARFVTVDEHGQTAVDRLYAAGRIAGLPSQAIVSAGDGARVAISIIERVRGGYYVDHDT